MHKSFSEESAAYYAKHDCNECGGTGWLTEGHFGDEHQVYCICALENMADAEADAAQDSQ